MLVGWIVLCGTFQGPGTASQLTGPLRPGQVIVTELAGGGEHLYLLEVTADQYLEITVEQRNVDVELLLDGPAHQRLLTRDSVSVPTGLETLFHHAEATGMHRLTVASRSDRTTSGHYRLTFQRFDEPTPAAVRRADAESLFREASELLGQPSEETLRSALSKLGQARKIWDDTLDASWVARTLAVASLAHLRLGESPAARELATEGLEHARGVEDRGAEALLLNHLAESYDRMGAPAQAIAHYRQAEELYRSIADRFAQARVSFNRAVVHGEISEAETAIELHKGAMVVFRRHGASRSQAAVLTALGLLLEETGKPELAIERYEEALPLRRAAQDRRGEAITLNNIAKAFHSMGDHQSAVDHYRRALEAAEDIADPEIRNTLHSNLGAAYRRLGDPQRARNHYEHALAAHQSEDTPNPRGLSTVLNNLAILHGDEKQYVAALALFQRALELIRTHGYKRSEAPTLENIGRMFLVLERFDEAEASLSEALQLYRETKNLRGQAGALYGIGSLEIRRGHHLEALGRMQEGLELARAAEDTSYVERTLLGIAQAERKLGHLHSARTHLERSLASIESRRWSINTRGLRSSFFASKMLYFELLVDILMALHEEQPDAGYAARALEVNEQARGRALLELLFESRADLSTGFDPELLERERSLLRKIEAREKYRQRTRRRHQPVPQAINVELRELQLRYDELQTEFRRLSPRTALTQNVSLNLQEIRDKVLDDRTVLLEYSLGKERSFLWVVTKKRLRSYVLPPRADIESAARRFHTLIERSAKETTARSAMREVARELGALLLSPVEAEGLLAPESRLLIVPDGALGYVPFAALPIRSGSAKGLEVLLGANHEITHLASASALFSSRQQVGGRARAPRSIAVVADPVSDPDDERLERLEIPETKIHDEEDPGRTAESGTEQFPRLRYSSIEAKAIIDLTEPPTRFLAQGFDASRELLESHSLAQYRYVHLATHGVLNTSRPELSGVVLSLWDRNGSPQEGVFTLLDVFNLSLHADLVTLSGCQTILGQEIRSEGFFGLAQGLLYAGSARVLGSLWNVDDEATSVLMVAFYRRLLQEDMSPAAALAGAQRELRQSPRWAAPYFWAPFILYGEW